MTLQHDTTMTTAEQNAKDMVRKLNEKYNKMSITFDYYVEGQIIFITSATPARHFRVGIEQTRFLFDDSLIRICEEIEEGLASTNMIQGEVKELIQVKAYIRTLQNQLKQYEENNLILKDKIELQESLIQELKHIIETNEMNTRKRG